MESESQYYDDVRLCPNFGFVLFFTVPINDITYMRGPNMKLDQICLEFLNKFLLYIVRYTLNHPIGMIINGHKYVKVICKKNTTGS